jgi:hypothetical protein
MSITYNYQIVDFAVYLIANLSNIFVTIIMLSRPKGWKRLEHYVGLINIILVVPLITIVILNLLWGREWWTFVLPILLIIFDLLELILDYILKIEFRKTRLLGPYLLLFYLSQWAMIGYTFQVTTIYGIITLITYFISLGSTAYSYKKVGHGEI